jgi:hypothetical protein
MIFYKALYLAIFKIGPVRNTRILIQTTDGKYILGLVSNEFRDRNNLKENVGLILPMVKLSGYRTATQEEIQRALRNPIRLSKKNLDLLENSGDVDNSEKAMESKVDKKNKTGKISKSSYAKMVEKAVKKSGEDKENEIEQDTIIDELMSDEIPSPELIKHFINQLKNNSPGLHGDVLINVNGKRHKRDNHAIALIKIVYDFKCQICGKAIIKRNGKRYIEAAHIIPKSKGGGETLDNILVLCPNHHKEFDLGKRGRIINEAERISFILDGKEYSVNKAH